MANIKPIELCTGARTKEEIEERKNVESKLKGESKIPTKAPEFLYLCNEGKKSYELIVEYIPEEVFNYLDSFTVGIVADALAKMNECRRILAKEGMLVEYTNKAGATNISEHKAVSIYQKYSQIFNTFGAKLGLSPVDRAKLSLVHTKEGFDEFETLLNS